MTDITKLFFPQINPKFKNVLNKGFTENKFKKGNQLNETNLVILDITGSMGDYLNSTKDYSKAATVKILLNKLQALGLKFDILPFNTCPHPICTIENIPEPNECTNFSPIVSYLKTILAHKKYGAILFVSDGLPSEPMDTAHSAISKLGTITREAGANPVSIAVGNDADGAACALFSGNRGYECFLKYSNQMDSLINDIINGINCNYVMLDSGEYIPVESNGNYYYLTSEEILLPSNITIELITKYINIIVLEEFSKTNPDYNELKSFIENITTKVISDSNNKNMIISYFNNMIGTVLQNTKDQFNTPSDLSARKNAYRGMSQQV